MAIVATEELGIITTTFEATTEEDIVETSEDRTATVEHLEARTTTAETLGANTEAKAEVDSAAVETSIFVEEPDQTHLLKTSVDAGLVQHQTMFNGIAHNGT